MTYHPNRYDTNGAQRYGPEKGRCAEQAGGRSSRFHEERVHLAEVSEEGLAGLLEQLWGSMPGDLEPQPRRRGRLALLGRRQPTTRPSPAGQRRTAPR
jgi:hypothetical protein